MLQQQFRFFVHSICSALIRAVPVFLVWNASARAQTYEWKVVARPDPAYPLYSVDFADSLHGVAGGGHTTGFFVTSDGGFTWQEATGAVFLPQAIDLLDSTFGWAGGTRGRGESDVGRTTDGGRSWTLLRWKEGEEFHGVAGLSRMKCVCAGFATDNQGVYDTAMIVRTTDGGVTWERTLFNGLTRLGRVLFVDSLTGWVRTWSTPDIMRTTDGGTSWQKLSTPKVFEAFDFVNRLQGWGGYSHTFYGTTDGGVTWQYLYTVPFSTDDFGVTTLAFPDTVFGWAFGDGFWLGIITEVIYRTTDAGGSWWRESIGLTGDFGGLADGMMLDREHGWAVADDGSVLAYGRASDYVQKDEDPVPARTHLEQNYPNPFNGETHIRYALTERTPVFLAVFDLLGRMVAVLVNDVQDPGPHGVRFEGKGLSSGIYFCVLRTNHHTFVSRMTYTK